MWGRVSQLLPRRCHGVSRGRHPRAPSTCALPVQGRGWFSWRVLGCSDFWTGEGEADPSPCLLSLRLSHLLKCRNGLRFQTGLGWSFVSRTRRCLEFSDHRWTGGAAASFPPAPLPAMPSVRHTEEPGSAEHRAELLLSCGAAGFLLESVPLIQSVFNSAFPSHTRELKMCRRALPVQLLTLFRVRRSQTIVDLHPAPRHKLIIGSL